MLLLQVLLLLLLLELVAQFRVVLGRLHVLGLGTGGPALIIVEIAPPERVIFGAHEERAIGIVELVAEAHGGREIL